MLQGGGMEKILEQRGRRTHSELQEQLLRTVNEMIGKIMFLI